MNFLIPDRWAALAAQYPELTVGRITLQEKGMYRIRTSMGEQNALVSGKFQFDAQSPSDYPAVGDYVMVSCADLDTAVIHQMLPRKSLFVRKAAGTSKTEQVVAANIDTVFLCMSLNNDFNLRRLERYLSVAWESGADPVVVLTKADLCGDLPQKQREVEAIAMGVDIFTTSAMESDGYRQIMPYITQGRTVAFVGSSGVGKSTLINRLLGEERLATDGLRNDDKGHHTTTHRELLFLPNGAMVIDTPGMRELGMWDAASGVEQTFGDIEELAARCRFRNCSHSGEPGCAVRAALESGHLDAGRWLSYQKLKNENSYAADSESYLAAKEKKFKEISKINKYHKKR
ncbi:ribosome small subunit-dependent GTPase A [Pseudoflavonifractor phocaeensis]|uniref:ribosome small subunit-dependent GTPase A n=1 Tax=Pseudoflavonifractor phocaeensis TaxID=1870988 RepID=UPI001F3A1652|nr:ribosome small subunit-dependent GTPase A [Pseudoflavonifractor phocaeensis]MCF2596888.1 ribosome small subunit-dependent GTPase A [Pseudoflavonifractor phocaeensis]